jgi:hypothetical protein
MLVGVDVTAVTVSAASENCDRATANNQTFGPVTLVLRRSTEGLVLRKSRVWMNVFRCFLAEGEIGGTPCMQSHIFTHLATTISIAKPFVVKMKIEKEGLPRDSPRRRPPVRIRAPRPKVSSVFSSAYKKCFSRQTSLWNSGRQEV